MARTNKIGLDYFPLDVDFFNDEKIEFTAAKFGIIGELIPVRILCKLYRQQYYCEWNDDEAILLSKRIGNGVDYNLINEVILELVKRDFFNKNLFEKFGILTSRGIQSRYFEATCRYKSVKVNREFLLVDVSKFNNVHFNSINVNINSINDNTCTQIEKEKEIESKNEKEIENVSTLIDENLSKKIQDYFGFNEIANFDKIRQISDFLRCLDIGGKTETFRHQFEAYIEFKKINNSYTHSFKNFLGTQDVFYMNGAWNAENWHNKLLIEKNGKSKHKATIGVGNKINGRDDFGKL
jgi:hypothetical protein